MIELEPGLRWVRRKQKPYDRTQAVWSIAELKGHVPFLTAEIIYVNKESASDSEFCSITNPEEWEWGPTIKIPDKDRKEIQGPEIYQTSMSNIQEFLK